MAAVWKVLLGLALVVPMGAYVVGALAASAADDPAPRQTIQIRVPDPTPGPTSPPSPTQTPRPEVTDQVEVITPDYDDVDDHDDRGDDDDGGHHRGRGGGHG